jgi:hypothetical protein
VPGCKQWRIIGTFRGIWSIRLPGIVWGLGVIWRVGILRLLRVLRFFRRFSLG